MNKKVILLVEDDRALAMGTVFVLESEGYEVRHAANLEAAGRMLDDSISLLLLDVLLPDGSGYDFCRRVREDGITIPIIFLTAMSEEANIVQGLSIGGDDYVAKPYRMKELTSRIAAHLRRYEMNRREIPRAYTFGRHRFLADELRLYDGDTLVDCTQSELRLLKELVTNAGVVLTRGALLDRLYDMDGALIDDNTLSVYMKRLRGKLGEDAGLIETVRGVGYRFVG